MKLLIISGKRSGKDTLCEFWALKFGLKHKSSSLKAAEIFLYDALKDKYNYKSFEECYEDRHNHRAEWYELIKEYNKDDRARLAKEILKDADCYCGMRDRQEILECKRQKIFDLIIWVDASERVEPEDKSSFNIEKDLADIIIENNKTEIEFLAKALRLGKIIFQNGN